MYLSIYVSTIDIGCFEPALISVIAFLAPYTQKNAT